VDRYIEVIGEGCFEETAARFIADVVLEVRAAKEETALREVGELREEALSVLRSAGIVDEEIVEGGLDVHRPWHWKNRAGQTATRKLLLRVEDFGSLSHALKLLEPLQSHDKDRKTVSVQMRQPEFADVRDGKSTALIEAFTEARAKATRLAAAMNGRLGQVLSVEEGKQAKRNSGFTGDEDWNGDDSRFAMGGGVLLAAAGAASEPEPTLQRPTRTIYVNCRVRFALEES
jgi:uncharacterized protein YggE